MKFRHFPNIPQLPYILSLKPFGNLCGKSYPDCNVTIIRQRITYLENKNKILNKSHNDRNSYYLIDDSTIIPDDSASLDDP